MPAVEPVAAWRVVATPGALDEARWRGADVHVLRIAPDEALVIGADGVDVDDPDAIVQPDAGFSCARLSPTELRDVALHVEWHLPEATAQPEPVLAQGKVAGTPAKLLIGDPTILVVQTCYVDDLRARLRW